MTAFDAVIAKARAIPIEGEVTRRGLKLARVGAELVGECPVCGGKDRFAINPKKGKWNCRGCQKGGDIISLVMHVDDIEFKEAIEHLTADKVTPETGNGAAKPKLIRTLGPYEFCAPATGAVAYRKTREEYSDGSKKFFFDPPGRDPPLLYGGEQLADLGEHRKPSGRRPEHRRATRSMISSKHALVAFHPRFKPQHPPHPMISIGYRGIKSQHPPAMLRFQNAETTTKTTLLRMLRFKTQETANTRTWRLLAMGMRRVRTQKSLPNPVRKKPASPVEGVGYGGSRRTQGSTRRRIAHMSNQRGGRSFFGLTKSAENYRFPVARARLGEITAFRRAAHRE